MVQTVLVTGGLGYIGSHTSVQLLLSGHKVVIIDNLSNSKFEVHNKIKKLGGEDLEVYIGDVCNLELLQKIFSNHQISLVIHFAGLKSVTESIENPLMYYNNNLNSTLNLLNVMEKYNVKKLIFSSSATVYGLEGKSPIDESSEVGKNITSPYGKSKFIIEEILRDLKGWSIVILRYFNPVGCHPTGLLGEDPKGIPNNLFPYILKASSGELPVLQIYGSDYSTHDGTCIRDFIHVEDLAEAHLCSIQKLEEIGVHTYNVGTGKGVSVLEIVNTFQKVNNLKLNIKFTDRRPGDIPILFANADKIKEELGWESKRDLEDICKDGYEYILNVNRDFIQETSSDIEDMDISYSDFSDFTDSD